MDHVIIDTLHLFLRISDNLFELLIRELKRQDAIDKVKTFPCGFNREKYKHMAGYEHFLRQTGISFEWRVEPNTKKLEYRDLTGPEKLRVNQNINIQALLPNFEDHRKLENLWNDFMEIIGDLKLDFPTDEPIASLTAKIKSWFQQFLSISSKRCDTLYACSLPSHSRIFETVHQCSTFQPARHGKI